MTPQPIDGTLLAAFTRFADLSCYWHRHGTPDSLALSELQERNRLATDLPELIKRLTAFASLNTEPRFEAEARVVVEPPRDNQGTTPPATEYRMLEAGELIQPEDEWWIWDKWFPVAIINEPLCLGNVGKCRRKVVSNDTAGQCAEMEGKRDREAAKGQSGASGDGWRMLENGEVVETGDEYQTSQGAWLPTNFVGDIQGEPFCAAKRRRRIPSKHPESDRAALGIANLIERETM